MAQAVREFQAALEEGAGRGELRRLRERVRGMCAAVEAQLGGDAARHPVLAAALAGVED